MYWYLMFPLSLNGLSLLLQCQYQNIAFSLFSRKSNASLSSSVSRNFNTKKYAERLNRSFRERENWTFLNQKVQRTKGV